MPIEYDALGRAKLVEANPTPSPYDSEYASGVARMLFQNPLARREITSQGEQDKADLSTQLSRLARSRAEGLTSAKYAANKQGLLYSGHLGKQQGEINRSFDEQQGDAQTGFDRREADRQSGLSQIGDFRVGGDGNLVATGQAGLDYGDIIRQAQDRARGRAQDALIADAPTTPPPTAPPPPASLPGGAVSPLVPPWVSGGPGAAKKPKPKPVFSIFR